MKVPDLVTLTCVQLTELATDYMTGELAPEDRARLEQHLYACTWCMTHVNQLRRTVDWTKQLASAHAELAPESRESLLQMFERWRVQAER